MDPAIAVAGASELQELKELKRENDERLRSVLPSACRICSSVYRLGEGSMKADAKAVSEILGGPIQYPDRGRSFRSNVIRVKLPGCPPVMRSIP